MSLIYPENRTEISNRMKTDVQNQLPDSDPFLRASFIWTLIIAYSGVVFDLYSVIQDLQNELFPDTASENFAERWGNFKGITRNPAFGAKGKVNATGILDAIISADTLLQTADGKQYSTNDDYKITEHTINVDSIVRSGTTATVTTLSEHNYASNLDVTISGADQAEYNITASIVVTGLKTFHYEVSGTPTTPATGTMQSTATFADMSLSSVDFGFDTNIDGGNALTFVTPIAGIDLTTYTEYEGLSGGADVETDDQYRNRYIDAYQNPIAHFSVADIEAKAKTQPGVTRVFVASATPDAGQCEVLFMRDNDENPIPNSEEINEVKNLLLTIKPVEMEDVDLIVLAPTPVIVNFTFSLLDPDTTAMRNAIEANLEQFFKEVPEVGINLSEDGYRSAIYQTIDPETGQFVRAFSLDIPSADIPITIREIAILGDIQWSV